MQTTVKPAFHADSSHELEIQKKRLRDSCREFESVMVSYMMKTMRNGTLRAEEPGSAREMYEDMLAGEVSKKIGLSAALGIEDMLYSKLEPLLETQTSVNNLNNSTD